MASALSHRARLIANVLLQIHGELCRGRDFQPASITDAVVKERTITYKKVFERAGFYFNRSNVAAPLGEIAVWCTDRNLPPLHSLVVTSSTGRPGHNYHGGLRNWHKDVRDCIACDRYPDSIPE